MPYFAWIKGFKAPSPVKYAEHPTDGNGKAKEEGILKKFEINELEMELSLDTLARIYPYAE